MTWQTARKQIADHQAVGEAKRRVSALWAPPPTPKPGELPLGFPHHNVFGTKIAADPSKRVEATVKKSASTSFMEWAVTGAALMFFLPSALVGGFILWALLK